MLSLIIEWEDSICMAFNIPMLIDTKILDELSERAKESERLSPRFHVAAGSEVIGINVPAGQ